VVVSSLSFILVLNVVPSNQNTQMWLDQHTSIFHQLEMTHETLRNAEANHQSFVITGEKRWLDAYKTAKENLQKQIVMLRGMRQDDPQYSENVRQLSNQLSTVFGGYDQTIKVRQTQGVEAARNLDESSQHMDDRKALTLSIEKLQEQEFKAVEERTLKYNNLISAGPYPWLAFIMVAGLLGVILIISTQKRQDSTDSKRIGELTEELTHARAQLEHISNLDIATDALNMRGLEQVLKVEENRINRGTGSLIAVMVACDDFNKIIEEKGTTAAEKVLREITKRIVGTLRPSDHVARTGDDEFLVLLPDTQLAYGMRVAERLRLVVLESDVPEFKTANGPITLSLGVTAVPNEVKGKDDIIEIARQALERSKQAGKNSVSVNRNTREATTTQSLIEQLLAKESYRAVYQPIINLSTKEVVGFEMLIRGPEGAFESPDDLFRLSVENNILTKVDLQCLRLCTELSSNIASLMRVHLNIFPSTILDTDPQELISIFPTNKEGKVFCIEISEQHFIGDPAYMRDRLLALRHAGILIAVDDIGFGRASLETLILLEPDIVKVDRKYVNGIGTDPTKVRMLKRLANVAKSLGVEMIAEGIENAGDLPVLGELGIHFGQGFLWGKLLEVVPPTQDDQRNMFLS
jgi:diguanylate cyclase (GGDEF)-like protein